MKNLNESLDRMRQLMELDIQHKKAMGDGANHVTFPMRDPEKVVKAGYSDKERVGRKTRYYLSDMDQQHVEVFQQFPELFPIVYKATDRYAVLEKLRTDPVLDDEVQMIQQIQDAEIDFPYDESIGGLYDYVYDDESARDEIASKLEFPELFLTYANLFIEVTRKLESVGVKGLDIHAHNMGYTKDGKLKLLDF